MKYKIEFTRAADKQLEDISKAEVLKLSKRIEKLASNPFPQGYEKLKGFDEIYRVRQGDYRILYSVFEERLIILILKIGHRKEVYR